MIVLVINLGGKSAGSNHITGLFSYLKLEVLQPSEIDSCLVSRVQNQGHIIVSVKVAFFPSVASIK